MVIGINTFVIKMLISQDIGFLHSFQESKRIQFQYIFEVIRGGDGSFLEGVHGVTFDSVGLVCDSRMGRT